MDSCVGLLPAADHRAAKGPNLSFQTRKPETRNQMLLEPGENAADANVGMATCKSSMSILGFVFLFFFNCCNSSGAWGGGSVGLLEDAAKQS